MNFLIGNSTCNLIFLVEGLKSIYMKVTHRMDTQVFKNILSLATGKSKRGGKKKKKKKGNGKVIMKIFTLSYIVMQKLASSKNK